jgi:ribosomal protein S1
METDVVATQETEQPVELAEIKRKTKFTGTVIKTALAGALVDIGLGTPGVIHISQLQKEPTNRVEDVVKVGQSVEVWVKRVEPRRNRIELTMIEPLDLEWREIKKGMVIKGKVTRLESFGVFVDIGAERPGLVHISEITHEYIKTPGEVVNEGDEIEVQVLEVNRRKKQIKLSMKSLEEKPIFKPKAVAPKKEAKKEEVEEEPVPTAMEMALREAMERTKDDDEDEPAQSKQRESTEDKEFEAILSRTLENKVRTAK